MTWECQGRQEHGWFGSGTCGADGRPDAAVAVEVLQVAYAAVGHLPAQERGPYEGWLQRDGLAQLRATVPAWVAGAGLGAGAFRQRFFDGGSTLVAAHAHGVASQVAGAPPGPAGTAARLAAGRPLAALVRAAGPGRIAQVMEAAKRQAARAPVRPALTPEAKRVRDEKNVRDLAALLETEAGGSGRLGMVAVGSTVMNRMRRNGSANVRDEWGVYRHGKTPTPGTVAIARAILGGQLPDPTGGATHYYSPQSMTKETAPNRRSNGRMLESVPGVIDDDTKQPTRNERPAYALAFEAKPMPGIPESMYKFYKQPEDGRRVR